MQQEQEEVDLHRQAWQVRRAKKRQEIHLQEKNLSQMHFLEFLAAERCAEKDMKQVVVFVKARSNQNEHRSAQLRIEQALPALAKI